ncbi:Mrp/NBP35 family ATP-binding protein [Halomicroarcula sp. F27]|uniref:Iron-sulfur cluster carrier protein n=1 Tax=Haloarcula nitratireducens TaxID=2487749 RepID=A0AAW4PGY0_9EURY|nr:Mrp/NBP35 family ATP-binding protein [Halomicroarcula nitratireducens]MBX0296695.1 Mrp/NBP35 family ATP-binding protein [Halomicroarcula nitratireducens]
MTPDDLRDRLSSIDDPDLGDDVVSSGLVREVTVGDGTASINLALGAVHSPTENALAEEVRSVVREAGLDPDLSATPERKPGAEQVLPGVDAVVAVASGKGGVGKSTVASNLAAGLADRGASVGLFDADVYGPNAPQMLGVEAAPEIEDIDGEKRLVPPESHGVEVASVGSLVGDDDPVIWRGPMAHSALTDLFDDVAWTGLDYLVVDLPPGTGDVQMSVLQTLPVTGALVVTTPQAVATDDTRRSMRAFGEFDTPVLGVVENMRTFVCPDCESAHDVFGAGGGEELADETGLPYLGALPLDPAVREGGDDGTPLVLGEGETAETFRSLAGRVADKVGLLRRHRRMKNVAGSEGVVSSATHP